MDFCGCIRIRRIRPVDHLSEPKLMNYLDANDSCEPNNLLWDPET